MLTISATLAFSQSHEVKPNDIVSSYNKLSNVRKSQIDASNENARTIYAILAISVIAIVIAIVVISAKKRKNIKIKRVIALIEQGIDRDSILQTLKSEGLKEEEGTDIYYEAIHKNERKND